MADEAAAARPAPLSGIDQIRAMIARGKRPPMMETLDMALVEIEPGRAVFEAVPSRAVYNPLGTVHGGYAATLLDSACGLAVHSRLQAGTSYTTLELKVAYHRPMTADTGTVRAIGTLLSIGRRAAFAEAKLIDANDRLYASATSTLMILEPRE